MIQKTKEQIVDTGVNVELPILEELILDNEEFSLPESVCSSKGYSGAGVLTVINSSSGGKRLEIAKAVATQLELQERVAISLGKDKILIGEPLAIKGGAFVVRKQGNKSIIYSTALVQEITTKYKLNFEKGVSKTFTEVEYAQQNGYIVALIKMA